MEAVTTGVYLLNSFPKHAINAYLADDILIDAGVRFMRPSLMRQLRERRVILHLLTHAHPDHQGSSHAICAVRRVPLWCSAPDAPAMEHGDLASLLSDRLTNRIVAACAGGPPHPVTRLLREGDRIGQFTVIETPGHTPGHLSFWREADRTLILGDVLANQHPVTQRVGLIEPLARFTVDPHLNRRSIRKIAALEPRLICFGHGPPLRDMAQLRRFVDRLHD